MRWFLRRNHGIKLAKVGGSLFKQGNTAVEISLEVVGVSDTPEVYKMSMVRMS